MKKYLKTFEDIEALRNTDTKIYCEKEDGYVQFVNGWPCRFLSNGDKLFGGGIFLSSNPYIKVPDKPDKSWIGQLGWFWDGYEEFKCIDVLERMEIGHYWVKDSSWSYSNFRPLTPEEIEELTGYKVVKEN